MNFFHTTELIDCSFERRIQVFTVQYGMNTNLYSYAIKEKFGTEEILLTCKAKARI
jgi:hypothetical protein